MTATITEKEKEGIPHHLFDMIEPWEEAFNVRRFKELFWETIKEVRDRGNVPVVVGGTNYYLEATLAHFEKPSIAQSQNDLLNVDASLCKRLQASISSQSFVEKLDCLKQINAEAASIIIKNDIRRLDNALKRILDDFESSQNMAEDTMDSNNTGHENKAY